jgi:hypothetical protein
MATVACDDDDNDVENLESNNWLGRRGRINTTIYGRHIQFYPLENVGIRYCMTAQVGLMISYTDIACRRDIDCECRGIRLLAQTYLYHVGGILFQFNRTRKHKYYLMKEDDINYLSHVVGSRTSASLRYAIICQQGRHYYLLSREY